MPGRGVYVCVCEICVSVCLSENQTMQINKALLLVTNKDNH